MKIKPKMKNGDYEITTYLRAKVGDRVYAKNYRMKPSQWEPGEVVDVDVSVNRDLRTDASYRVMLDRESKSQRFGGGMRIFITVGDHSIAKIND